MQWEERYTAPSTLLDEGYTFYDANDNQLAEAGGETATDPNGNVYEVLTIDVEALKRWGTVTMNDIIVVAR